ncbi:hypothetical protein AXG93_1944s1060 [Marchantia polymorpha subsp. ruderalis]|uniref:Uncharacterized protein n=1 Tax=Marchantia polymorpha subsp. ruderalis TaxID=1480154 RepID=A0A176VDJ3_MARPO|nr:hypothetical protein AXG93_1944s1060 [Marchantia polymorpha subsp. ruderalis]
MSLNDDLAQSHPESENTVSNWSSIHIKDCNPSSVMSLRWSEASEENYSILDVCIKINQLGEKLGEKFDGVHETLRSLERIVKGLDVKMGRIISLQQQLQSMLGAFMSKAGLDVTLGLGEATPQWYILKTDIVKLDDISDIDGWAIRKGGHSVQLNEAWLRIQQTLAPQLKDSIPKIFKLYQVKYVRQPNGGHARSA